LLDWVNFIAARDTKMIPHGRQPTRLYAAYTAQSASQDSSERDKDEHFDPPSGPPKPIAIDQIQKFRCQDLHTGPPLHQSNVCRECEIYRPRHRQGARFEAGYQ
jgi:hypothetical protein